MSPSAVGSNGMKMFVSMSSFIGPATKPNGIGPWRPPSGPQERRIDQMQGLLES
jgi:hypothetical protein